ncbi:MAG: SDR family oxidoreductase [Pseudomonadota bacterium]
MFNNTSSVITGAASGIGAATARQISSLGGSVVLLDIDEERGNALAEELKQTFVKLDVTNHQQWQSVVSSLDQKHPLTYAFINAGIQIAPPQAPLSEYEFLNMQMDRYRNMMGVNVDGVVFGLLTLLPELASGGSIVVTSSLAGVTPYGVDPLYSMSKHAVTGLVRSLASTCAKRDLTINAICPGGVDTNIIPEEQRTDGAVFMDANDIAEEVIMLMGTPVNGKTWAKVATNKPAWIIRAPGDKEG